MCINDLNNAKDNWIKLNKKDKAKLLKECLEVAPRISINASKTAARIHGSYGDEYGEEL